MLECALNCNKNFYCSAFRFDKKEKICQLGTSNQTTDSSSSQKIPVHVNPNFVDSGIQEMIIGFLISDFKIKIVN